MNLLDEIYEEAGNAEASGLDPEHQKLLERISRMQLHEHLRVSLSMFSYFNEYKSFFGFQKSVTGSPSASDRLKKELIQIWNSESLKNKLFTVELVNDSLYEWNVRLLLSAFPFESAFYHDLLLVLEQKGCEGILLHFQFENFPFEPPFVRVKEPVLIGKTENYSLAQL